MIVWVHIFTVSVSTLIPTACYAASENPWTETIQDNVTHHLIGESVSDTGRPGKKYGKVTLFLLYYYLL
jgi:hypothetical protein